MRVPGRRRVHREYSAAAAGWSRCVPGTVSDAVQRKAGTALRASTKAGPRGRRLERHVLARRSCARRRCSAARRAARGSPGAAHCTATTRTQSGGPWWSRRRRRRRRSCALPAPHRQSVRARAPPAVDKSIEHELSLRPSQQQRLLAVVQHSVPKSSRLQGICLFPDSSCASRPGTRGPWTDRAPRAAGYGTAAAPRRGGIRARLDTAEKHNTVAF